MKEKMIVGADISKQTIDVHIKPSETFLCIENNAKGFKQLRSLMALDILVVMEHTGRYSRKFEAFLTENSISYCKVAALEIKRSIGLQRGKTDKIDAKRIADYAWLRKDIITADEPSDTDISMLKDLWSLRSKLVRDRAGYVSRLKELKATSCKVEKYVEKIHDDLIKKFTLDILQLEAKIREIISSNEAIQKTFNLISSIKGIGLIVAVYMICSTGNFTRFENARKFNCYAGLAPFKHESGSSIKGRSRVSHLANKEIKTLLNLAASSAIRHNSEMKKYYQKRVSEGKRKMSCLNIVRSKLVARMFAVVKRQSPYVELYTAA